MILLRKWTWKRTKVSTWNFRNVFAKFRRPFRGWRGSIFTHKLGRHLDARALGHHQHLKAHAEESNLLKELRSLDENVPVVLGSLYEHLDRPGQERDAAAEKRDALGHRTQEEFVELPDDPEDLGKQVFGAVESICEEGLAEQPGFLGIVRLGVWRRWDREHFLDSLGEPVREAASLEINVCSSLEVGLRRVLVDSGF